MRQYLSVILADNLRDMRSAQKTGEAITSSSIMKLLKRSLFSWRRYCRLKQRRMESKWEIEGDGMKRLEENAREGKGAAKVSGITSKTSADGAGLWVDSRLNCSLSSSSSVNSRALICSLSDKNESNQGVEEDGHLFGQGPILIETDGSESMEVLNPGSKPTQNSAEGSGEQVTLSIPASCRSSSSRSRTVISHLSNINESIPAVEKDGQVSGQASIPLIETAGTDSMEASNPGSKPTQTSAEGSGEQVTFSLSTSSRSSSSRSTRSVISHLSDKNESNPVMDAIGLLSALAQRPFIEIHGNGSINSRNPGSSQTQTSADGALELVSLSISISPSSSSPRSTRSVISNVSDMNECIPAIDYGQFWPGPAIQFSETQGSQPLRPRNPRSWPSQTSSDGSDELVVISLESSSSSSSSRTTLHDF